MTLAEIKNALAEVGVDVFYDHTPEDVSMPYICFKEVSARTISRDSEVANVISTIQVELYTTTKDETLEGVLQNALKQFIWKKELDFDGDDEYFASFYTFEIIR